MFLGTLGEQTVLLSKKSFESIQFVGSETASREIYYPKKSARDKDARAAYRKERGIGGVTDSVYLIDILRGGWENDDTRLRRIVSG
jgi:hypothetical protein